MNGKPSTAGFEWPEGCTPGKRFFVIEVVEEYFRQFVGVPQSDELDQDVTGEPPAMKDFFGRPSSGAGAVIAVRPSSCAPLARRSCRCDAGYR